MGWRTDQWERRLGMGAAAGFGIAGDAREVGAWRARETLVAGAVARQARTALGVVPVAVNPALTIRGASVQSCAGLPRLGRSSRIDPG
ncbi:MAG: hypothetical protein EA400_02960 [Chromatiaceae bacterium]|nr:MAG: hypothetical protein EA400_02960 [Chromatiaceae bacterium]